MIHFRLYAILFLISATIASLGELLHLLTDEQKISIRKFENVSRRFKGTFPP